MSGFQFKFDDYLVDRKESEYHSSYWLKEAIDQLEKRDILDAATDAKKLFDIFNARLKVLSGKGL